MAAGTIGDRPVVIRELMPEDLKLEMKRFSRTEAVARYLGGVVGNAHGGRMSSDDRARWAGELDTLRRGDAAPSWLWTTTVARGMPRRMRWRGRYSNPPDHGRLNTSGRRP